MAMPMPCWSSSSWRRTRRRKRSSRPGGAVLSAESRGRFAETVALYNEALESLVARLKQDRYVLAAILYGSLSHDQVWHKSDIDLVIIGREEKKPSRDREGAFCLVENGVNVHATLVPR